MRAWKKCISVVVLFAISSLIYAQNTWHSTTSEYYTEDLYNKALSGDALAQNDLGSCYDRGSGIEQNHDEAFKWFQKSAEQGFVWGEYNLGWYYFSGLGCQKDYSQGNVMRKEKVWRKIIARLHIFIVRLQSNIFLLLNIS